MGPGGDEYLLPVARQRIEESDFLVGAARHLDRYRKAGKVCHVIESSFSEALDSIEERRKVMKTAVLVSGDPCLFSYLELLRTRFGPEELEVLPGVSSFQLLCSRFACSYNNAKIVSVHGRPLAILKTAMVSNDRLVVFTDNENTPEIIARYLAHNTAIANEMEEWDFYIGTDLSYNTETVRKGRLAELARGPNNQRKDERNKLCVLILEKNQQLSKGSE